jgi:hypothetical protein
MKCNILLWNVRGLNCPDREVDGEEFAASMGGGYSVFAGDKIGAHHKKGCF